MTSPVLGSSARAIEDVLSDVPPIGPDALAEVDQPTRIDRRYLLDEGQVRVALAELPPGTRILEIGAHRTFNDASVYLDTPGLDSFLATAHPRRRPFRVRTRHYLDTDEHWLEVETRGARGLTVKSRRELPTSESGVAVLLHPDEEEFVAGVLRAQLIPDIDVTTLAPVLVTGYLRRTLLLPTGARCTIDSDLTWHTPSGARLERPDLLVVESKTGSAPSPLDRALWRHGIRPVRFSTFASGLAALDPSLPSNRWTRALADHLSRTA